MKYTNSADGKLRAELKVTIRLTKDEIEKYNAMARICGTKNVKEYLEDHIYNLIMKLEDDSVEKVQLNKDREEGRVQKIQN